MAKEWLITGLDIGTSAIKAIAALKRGDSPELEVLGWVREPILGVRRGVVIDPEEVAGGIRRAINQLRNLISGQEIEKVYVNIGGSHITVLPSRGTVVVSRADQNISEEDVTRVIQAAQACSLPPNKEILDVFPKEFIIDQEKGIKEPVGMQGVRLEAEVLLLCVFSPYLNNLTRAVIDSGLQFGDIIPSPIAAARALLTPYQKELGVILIDIGAGTTGIAVYEEGDLIHTAIVPIGSAHITNDIAIGLRTEIDIAEKIKCEFGLRGFESISKKEKIKVSEKDSLSFSYKFLEEIIEARISEILDLINKELKKISPPRLLPAGVVLTGGGSRLPKIVEFTKQKLKLPCRIGKIGKEWIGLEDDPSLATVAGLVLQGLDIEKEENFSIFGNRGIINRLKKIFKIFIP